MHRILIIEDDENVRDAVRMVLETAGYQVGEALNGAEGLSRFREGGWALVILDHRMPEMSGLEVLRRIHEADPNLPVVMVTAVDTVEMGAEALGAGARGFLTKPISVSELRAVVRDALSEDSG